MGQLLLAIFAGVVVNSALVFGVQSVNTPVNPLLLLAAYAVGAFGGGFVATKLAPRRGLMPALVVGQIALVVVLFNVLSSAQSVLIILASLLIPIILAWFGGKAAHARGGMK